MAKIVKIDNPAMLRKMVLVEAAKAKKLEEPKDKAEKDKVEVDDDGKNLNSLEKKVDFMKALKIKEEGLKRNLRKVQEQIKRLTEARKNAKKK